MRRHRGLQQRHVFLTAPLAHIARGQAGTIPLTHGNAPLQVRQGEIRCPVAAKLGAKQREQGGVLRDRQDLPVAKGPPIGGKVSAKYPDLTQKLVGHGAPSILRRKDAEQ